MGWNGPLFTKITVIFKIFTVFPNYLTPLCSGTLLLTSWSHKLGWCGPGMIQGSSAFDALMCWIFVTYEINVANFKNYVSSILIQKQFKNESVTCITLEYYLFIILKWYGYILILVHITQPDLFSIFNTFLSKIDVI